MTVDEERSSTPIALPNGKTIDAGDPDHTFFALWKTLDMVHESIKFADTKANIILFAAGVFATGASSRLVDKQGALHHNYLLIALVVLAAVLWLIAVYHAIRCIRPRLGTSDPTSLLYFGHIAALYPTDVRQYQRAAQAGLSNRQAILDEITQQIWANSRVAKEKHSNARKALDFLILSIVLTLTIGVKAVLGNAL